MTRTLDVANSNQPDGSAVSVRSDVVYANPAGVELRGDLYLPEGPGPFPVIVAAPGGAWLVCDRRGLKHWGTYLAKHGFAVFVIQYRLAVTEKMFPEAVCDVVSAVQFVRGAAGELNIDPDRIALLGTSAGAHLSSLAALAGDQPLFRPQSANAHSSVSPAVKAFAGVYGAYDLYAGWQHEAAEYGRTADGRSECFLGASPYADRQLYFDASPISHVRYAANKLPVFLAYGTADEIVDPRTQSEPFIRALQQAGFLVRTCPVVGAGHFWFSEEPIDEPGSFTGFLAPRLLRFLQRHL